MIADRERSLRLTGVVFAVALVVHGADHVRRGFDVLSGYVFGAGNLQLVMALITIVMVFRGHRLGPVLAVLVGLTSAAGFTAAHLLPHWSAFSDSFTGSDPAPHVTWFSWFAALFEIAADVAFGVAGLRVLRASAQPEPEGVPIPTT